MANILVVEDDPTIRELVRLHLASANHDVITASDGLQGLQLAVNRLPDIIVSDVQMPNMDGFGMLAAVRANEQTASIPVIFLTALDDRDSFRKSMNLGADDFLNKPVKRNELLNAITGRLKRLEGQRLSGSQLVVADETDTQEARPMRTGPGGENADTEAPEQSRQIDSRPRERDRENEARVPEPRSSNSSTRTQLRDPKKTRASGRSKRALDLTAHLTSMEESSPPDIRAATSRETVHGTILFADIRNFTTFSEILEPEQVVEFLNAFFGQACEPILDQAGWIVKFLGDGLVAMFDTRAGSSTDHAERALKAGVLMVLAAHRFKPWIREKHPGKNLPEFAIGVGIHTGEVSVCRMGAGEAAETTVIGDTVNIASRLEGKTKELGWSIVASRASADAAGRRFIAGRGGQLALKGRTGTVDIVEVIGMTARPGADTQFYELISAAIAANSAIIVASLQKNMTAQQRLSPSTNTPLPRGDAPINVDGYRLIRKLGEGGMSKVFLAEQGSSQEHHVLKMLPIAPADDEIGSDLMERFLQEFALVSQIDHPNVARIFNQGFTDAYAYISMEYFPGGDLRELIAKGLAPNVAVAILLQIGGALTAVHAQGIVHRDMKPDNVMIRADGSLALADFGIAKQTNSEFSRTKHGEVFGTPYYLAPEQALGLPVDQRTDIYSLGILFFEMLTGRRPFQADNAQALMYQHVNAPIPRLPTTLSAYQPLVDKMMAKKKTERFETANILIEYVLESGLIEQAA
ncbi:MAG TPA: protein kinase [Burkholderiales bacterium]|nr:protein kinase [Burkholderiales bacterium]